MRSDPVIAYFSMEIALEPRIPTYAGGLGMLAGDTVRAAADQGIPLIAISLTDTQYPCCCSTRIWMRMVPGIAPSLITCRAVMPTTGSAKSSCWASVACACCGRSATRKWPVIT